MRVAGSFDYDAPPSVMYRIFTDPDALSEATPGHVTLKEIAPDRYEAELVLGWPPLTLVYRGTLEVKDRVPDQSFYFLVEATTTNNFGRGEAYFRFLPLPGSRCRVEYDADVQLGGVREVLPTLARQLADYFMRGMAQVLAQRREEFEA